MHAHAGMGTRARARARARVCVCVCVCMLSGLSLSLLIRNNAAQFLSVLADTWRKADSLVRKRTWIRTRTRYGYAYGHTHGYVGLYSGIGFATGGGGTSDNCFVTYSSA